VPRKKGDGRHPNEIPEPERWYFLEEKYPTYGNLLPRDIATREIFQVCREGYSVNAHTHAVYLDLTERATGVKRGVLEHKLGAILEIYRKFRGVDPLAEPMQIFPAVHYSMGGLWVDYQRDDRTGGLRLDSPRNQQTNVPGLFAIGECDYQYHGANRLGANALLSCIFSGLLVGRSMRSFLADLPGGSVDKVATSVFDAEVARHTQEYKALLAREGRENAYLIHRELGELMTRHMTVVRHNPDLRRTLDKLEKLAERYRHAPVADRNGTWTNQSLSFTRAVGDMILLARVITECALLRDECRGAHYKPEFELPAPSSELPAELRKEAEEWCRRYREQNDRWLKTTLAMYTPDGPRITYEPVDLSSIPPRPRTYGIKGAEIVERVWAERYGAGASRPGPPG
jgi:succinate dehydrogenase / fumarate reductase flavoprotein subunit